VNQPLYSLLCKAAALFCILLPSSITYAGEGRQYSYDTLPPKASLLKQLPLANTDTPVTSAKAFLQAQKQKIAGSAKKIASLQPDSLKSPVKALRRSMLPQLNVFPASGKEQLLQFKGAFVNYNLHYRSNLDTPYVQRNLVQHSATGNADLAIAGLPLRVWWLVRKSNSIYFRDIYDARLEFNVQAFKDGLLTGYRNRIKQNLLKLKDSIAEKLYLSKEAEWKSLASWLNNPLTRQRLVEMNEVARIPALTYDVTLPDSIAQRKSDSLRGRAKEFLDMYERRKQQYHALTSAVDSLKAEYYASVKQFERLKNALGGNFNNWHEFRRWRDSVSAYSRQKLSIPKQYQWLMGIRNFSAGKSPVNYSELTARNISVNGLNLEYNSWYYFAVTAGFVDYRFRDFSLPRFRHSPQYLLMVRAGVGDVQKNYVILSLLKGQKQLYRSGDRGPLSYAVAAMALEARYQLSRHSCFSAEVSQSQSPSFQLVPAQKSRFWDFSDKNNKAFAVKLFSFLPATGSRVEAMYKYTGANYQSFNSFQSNSGLYAWYVKADQQLFKKQLRISAAVKANEFFNPYVIQAYNSNTVFKSFQASFKKRKWPSASIGYLPISQLTKIDNQVFENRFQTLNASLSHIYKLGVRQASTLLFTRFYNSEPDTSFAFFNASSFVFTQNIFFSDFSALVGISQIRNNNYVLNVLEGSLDVPVNRNINLGIGSKLNSLNNRQARVGYSGKLNVRFPRRDMFFLQFEKGYLSGRKDELVRNDLLNAGLIKYFN
jgi:hypothetical protein